MEHSPRGIEQAILVHLDLPDGVNREDFDEFTELAKSAGANVADTYTASRSRPDARYFVGSGQAEKIRDLVEAESATLVLFNHSLSPSQERNLEQLLKCRVLDRTGLILDIFAQRAKSFEGKLQVELAQLSYLSTRLVRAWTHLERQKGGIGLRGPGETQLETDRRLIGQRIKTLNRKLDKVRQQRAQGRRARARNEVPTASLVGYTNAGKSTLFNTITGADAYAADQLFATLDPTLRRMHLDACGDIVLADTVGFVRHLPHDLVAAFRSTLEETLHADLLLIVIDVSDENRHERLGQVKSVLNEIGAGEIPVIQVYNKIDLVDESPRIERDESGKVWRVWLSASTGDGLELLAEALGEYFGGQRVHGWVNLPSSAGRLRALFYEADAIRAELPDERGGWWLEIDLPAELLDRFYGREGVHYPIHNDREPESLAGAVQAP